MVCPRVSQIQNLIAICSLKSKFDENSPFSLTFGGRNVAQKKRKTGANRRKKTQNGANTKTVTMTLKFKISYGLHCPNIYL